MEHIPCFLKTLEIVQQLRQENKATTTAQTGLMVSNKSKHIVIKKRQ
jgi:hypothetical protein